MERKTAQRTAILTALSASRRALNPTELLTLARAAVPGLNLSTVYRQLQALLAEGLIVKIALPADVPRYEAVCVEAQRHAQHHHHHFLCSDCDRVFPIHACPGTMQDLAPTGFEVRHHDLTLYGLCGDCRAIPTVTAKAKAARPAARAR